MTTQTPQTVYSQASGNTSTGPLITQFFARAPTAQDISDWKIGQRWIDTSVTPVQEYILKNLAASGGFLTANWVQLGKNSLEVDTLTGNSGGAVGVDANNNINVVGDGTTITIVGNPATHTLMASLVGGQEAIDSFQPDSGTNPVVPDANGLVRMAGSGSITTVGSLNTLTTQLTGLTNHNVLVGAGTTTITKIAPSATVGSVFFSNGAAADPGYSTTFTVSDAGSIATMAATLATGGPQIALINLSNGANASARMVINTFGTGDIYTLLDGIAGSPGSWEYGNKNTINEFQLQSNPANTDPNGNMDGTITSRMTQGGVYSLPLQPAFLVGLTTSATNVTGNGGTYTFGTQGGGATTTNFDQGSNITSPAGVVTFTATVAGIYYFKLQLITASLSAAMSNASCNIVNSTGATINGGSVNVGVVRNSANTYGIEAAGLMLLAAGNTVTANLTISGGVGDTAGVNAGTSANPTSFFTGCKVA